MSESKLRDFSTDFAVSIIGLVKELKQKGKASYQIKLAEAVHL